MMSRLTLALLLSLQTLCTTIAQGYTPDILGESYEQRTINLPADYDGATTATLVRRNPMPHSHRAILYVHGYNDYFFQSQMGDTISSWGYNFYAIDLRRYGRSLQGGQYPFQVESLHDYFVEIDSALCAMQREGMGEIILMGHSTGGLITSLYCHHNRHHLRVQGLILNSPFLDMNMSPLMEGVVIPAVSVVGRLFPNLKVQGSSPSPYAESLHHIYKGEWSYDLDKKFTAAPPITARWIRAIHRGHRELQGGLEIPCPILLLYSDHSVYGSTWSEEFRAGDSVLDVKDMARYAHALGSRVTERVVKDGLHDLVLSPPAVREVVYRDIYAWLTKCISPKKLFKF